MHKPPFHRCTASPSSTPHGTAAYRDTMSTRLSFLAVALVAGLALCHAASPPPPLWGGNNNTHAWYAVSNMTTFSKAGQVGPWSVSRCRCSPHHRTCAFGDSVWVLAQGPACGTCYHVRCAVCVAALTQLCTCPRSHHTAARLLLRQHHRRLALRQRRGAGVLPVPGRPGAEGRRRVHRRKL